MAKKARTLVIQHDEERFAWERQQDETEAAWKAFVAYRDLDGVRSLRRAARIYYQTEGEPTRSQINQLKAWSTAGSWLERVRLYDDHRDEAKREAELAGQIAMSERHTLQTESAGTALMQPIVAFLEKIEEESKKPGNQGDPLVALKKLNIVDLFEVMARASRYLPRVQTSERTARGMPATASQLDVNVSGTVDHADRTLHDESAREAALRNDDVRSASRGLLRAIEGGATRRGG